MAISDDQFDAWLRATKKWNGQAIRRVLLVEANYFTPGSGTEATRYMATRGYTSDAADTPASQYYEPVIMAPPTFSSRLSEVFTGRSEAAWGIISIFNPGGERDAWLDDSWEGRELTMLYGDASWPRSDFRAILTGVSAGLLGQEANALALQVRDRAWDLNVRVPYGTYAVGAFPTAPIPLALGRCFNVSPLPGDDSTHEYWPGGFFLGGGAASAGVIVSATEVRENGVALVTSGLTITGVNTTTNVITTSANHGIGHGGQVVLGSGPPADAVEGRTYYAWTSGFAANELKLYRDRALSSLVDLTAATTGATLTGRNWTRATTSEGGNLLLTASPSGQVTADLYGEGPPPASHQIASVNATTNTLTLSAAHDLPDPSTHKVRVVLGGTIPGGLDAGYPYWVIVDGFTSTAFRVSYTDGGPAVDITDTTLGVHTVSTWWCADECAEIVRYVLEQSVSPAAAYIDDASFDDFSALCPQKLGSFETGDTTIAGLLDRLVDSVGAFWTFDFEGALHLGRFDAPGGSPALEIAEDEIVRDGLRCVRHIEPIRRYSLGYGRNHTVQPDVAGSVSEANRSLYGREWRQVEYENTWGEAAYLHPRDTGLVPSLLVEESDAEDEAERRATIYSEIRHVYELHCAISPFRVRLGQVIQVTHPRHGFESGRLAVIVGIRWTPARLGGMVLELFA